MQIVIDIPEEDYNQILNDREDAVVAHDACRQIAKGIILPKHEGLIDANALMQYCLNQKSRNVDCNDIARFPTVLEASKE